MQITKQEENALLGRTEVVAQYAYEGATPSRKKVLAAIAAALKAKPELVVLRKIGGNYGRQNATITAHVYTSREQLEKVEGKHLLKRLEKQPKEEKKQEAKPAEKPAEKEKAAEEEKATEETTPESAEKAPEE